MVRAGALRHTISIQQQATSQDAYGQPESSWSEVLNCRAAIEWTPGREVFAAAQRSARLPVVFRLRYRAGIRPSMRVQFDSRLFNLTSVVDPDGTKEQLLLTGEELVGAA